jgi:hypothetical protein
MPTKNDGATVAGVLLGSFKEWLDRAEELKDARWNDAGKIGQREIVTNEMFNQLSMITQFCCGDAEGRREVVEFVEREEPLYKSSVVQGCFSVLRAVDKLFEGN